MWTLFRRFGFFVELGVKQFWSCFRYYKTEQINKCVNIVGSYNSHCTRSIVIMMECRKVRKILEGWIGVGNIDVNSVSKIGLCVHMYIHTHLCICVYVYLWVCMHSYFLALLADWAQKQRIHLPPTSWSLISFHPNQYSWRNDRFQGWGRVGIRWAQNIVPESKERLRNNAGAGPRTQEPAWRGSPWQWLGHFEHQIN